MRWFTLIALMLGFSPISHAQEWRQFKVMTGDDPNYARPDFDDSAWPSYREWRRSPQGRDFQGNLWLRGQVTFDPHRQGTNLALAVVAVATWELYLDGQLIGANGRVGLTSDEELPGRSIFVAAIPPELATPGAHQLALRFSNHHGGHEFGIMGMGLTELNRIVSELRGILLPLMLTSAFFMVALYFFVLYFFSFREPAFLLFALLCTLVGTLYVVEQWRMVGYPYYWHETRLQIVVLLSAIVNLLLPMFFLVTHRLSLRYVLATPLLMAITGFLFGAHYDGFSFGFFLAGLSTALFVSVRAVWLNRPYARWSLTGCAIALVAILVYKHNFLEAQFFYCFILIILLMMIALSRQRREERDRYQLAQLTSARLETQLLQKQLQPHFMMNTLTAAIEWIEQNPPAAVRFIEALATEMRSLFAMSGRRLIRLSEELALCRAHLKTQAFRTGYNHGFTVDAENENVLIPPAVLLTLLENGLTHGLAHKVYDFQVTVDGEGRSIRFAVDHQDTAEPSQEGTGIRYIKARLEENFPGRWSLQGAADGQRWVTLIEIQQEG